MTTITIDETLGTFIWWNVGPGRLGCCIYVPRQRRLPAPFAVKEFLVHQEPLGSNQTEDKRFTGKLEQEDSFDEDSDESSTGDASVAMLNDESGNEDEGFDDSAYSGNRVIEFGKCS